MGELFERPPGAGALPGRFVALGAAQVAGALLFAARGALLASAAGTEGPPSEGVSAGAAPGRLDPATGQLDPAPRYLRRAGAPVRFEV